MCIHPRCGKRGRYRLNDTELGPGVDLCELHGPMYYKSRGGELELLYPFTESPFWKQKLEGIQKGEQ